MPKATTRVSPRDARSNAPPIATLTLEEATAALAALVHGRSNVPPLAELRAMVAARSEKKPSLPRRSPPAFFVLAVVVDGGQL